LTYPREKDEIDTELALMFVKEKKEKDVVISCVFGNRIDQEIASIYLLAQYIDLNPVILEEDVKVGIVNKEQIEEAIPGETWSIIRIGEPVEGLTLEGFKYPLINENIDHFKSLGISNQASENKVKITVNKGKVLYVRWINLQW
jgi:thiamine pyrophosphokinase